jgi:hypothetical protein
MLRAIRISNYKIFCGNSVYLFILKVKIGKGKLEWLHQYSKWLWIRQSGFWG